jgi:branched-chain amino acid transport system permease protein
MRTRRLLCAAALIALLGILPWLSGSSYYRSILNLAAIYLVVVMGLNVILGFVGELPFGYTAFFGLGAYASGITTTFYGWSFWGGLGASFLVSAVFGLLIGYPSLYLRGPYFALVSWAFQDILALVIRNWVGFTRGPLGIPGVPSPTIGLPGLFHLELRSDLAYYYLAVTFATLATLGVKLIRDSRVGRAFLAIRENEALAQALGVDAFRFKLLAFVISAVLGGMGGSLFAHYVGIVSPDLFSFYYITLLFSMAIIGGTGYIVGPILGVVFFTAVPEYLRAAQDLRLVLLGAVMVAAIVFMPRGFGGLLEALGDWFLARRRECPSSR